MFNKEDVDYEVIVVGGGPAGCAFVRSLIRLESDLRVLLIEKERFPRDKVCGDGLTFQAIPLVREVFPELTSLTQRDAGLRRVRATTPWFGHPPDFARLPPK